MITGNNRGNPTWANLPRKFNIAVSGSRDDFAHTHINDIGLQPVARNGTQPKLRPNRKALLWVGGGWSLM
jgi:sulfite reductase beta subunit-like hemoprotein